MSSRALLACLLLAAAAVLPGTAQRITTIQLDGVQYFISRMNPYSPELNYFLAYQYCRSLGLQLASFETKEKADSITSYLTNAGYNKYDFWTSGNNLGTDMYLWMSTGLPFNATFNYMRRGITADLPHMPIGADSLDPLDMPQGSTAPQRTARHGTEHVMTNGCVALKAPSFQWEPQHCGEIKDFICEQTRCYYYNYGSIPVSSAQGKPLSLTTTTTAHPLTSSSPPPPRSEHLPTHFTLNDLIGKLRPSTLDGLQSAHLKANALPHAHKAPPQIDSHYSRAADARRPEPAPAAPAAADDAAAEEATQGPYDEAGMLGDDPAAYLSAEERSPDEQPSTVEPDAAAVAPDDQSVPDGAAPAGKILGPSAN